MMMMNDRKHGRAVPVVASHVSQLNCLALFGIDERRYRLLVNKHRNSLRITRAGKLVLVPVVDFANVLAKLAEGDGTPVNETDVDTGDRSPVSTEYETADDILAAVGHRRVRR